MNLAPLKKNILPDAPSLRNLLGPSFIILGLGLGSGEVILWPYLSSNFGMGIIWGALLGLTFQFFMNMEIERYALAHGESVFVGLARKLSWISWWFIFSTLLPWIWPGIVASSAQIFGHIFGLENTSYLAIGMLVAMGLILSLGPVLYKTVETLQKFLIGIGVPSIFLLAILLAKPHHWSDLGKGIVGIGNNYQFFPEGMVIASFLAALAYAGAGGNLNLAQSFYIKEKGYGMGKYAGRITSLLTGKKEDFSIMGATFEPTAENVKKFQVWWKRVNTEHFIVFWLTGSITILLLSLLAYTTTFTFAHKANDISFVFAESVEIGRRIAPLVGTLFLVVVGSTLFATQLTVFDATSRIISENVLLAGKEKLQASHIPQIYYGVLWLQILAGIGVFLFGFTQPLQLLTTAAIMNAVAMFVHTGLMLWLNMTSLDKALRPSVFRVVAMGLAFVFYGGFSLYTLYDKFF